MLISCLGLDTADVSSNVLLLLSHSGRSSGSSLPRWRLPDITETDSRQWLVSRDFHRNYSSGTARDSHPIPFLSTPSYNGAEPECGYKVTQIRDNQTTNFETKVSFFGKLLKTRIEKSFLKPATNRGPYQLPYGNYTAIKQQKRHLFHCSIGYPIESTKLLSIPAT